MNVPGEHLIIAGSLGSRHHEVAAELAERLGRPFVNTLTVEAMGALANGQYDAAIGHEAGTIGQLTGAEPSVVAVRTETLTRGRGSNVIELLRSRRFSRNGAGCLTVFMDVPFVVAAMGARSAHHPEGFEAAATYDLFTEDYLYNRANAVARADVHFPVGNVSSISVVANALLGALVEHNQRRALPQTAQSRTA